MVKKLLLWSFGFNLKCSPCGCDVRFPIAVIFSIEDSQFLIEPYIFTLPLWNFPQPGFSGLKSLTLMWSDYFTPLVGIFPQLWSHLSKILTEPDDVTALLWIFPQLWSPLMNILIEPDAFTSMVWIFTLQWSLRLRFSLNLTLSHHGCECLHNCAVVCRSVEHSQWIWRFHTRVWIGPQLRYPVFDILIDFDAFTPLCEFVHCCDFLCWKFQLNIMLSQLGCESSNTCDFLCLNFESILIYWHPGC